MAGLPVKTLIDVEIPPDGSGRFFRTTVVDFYHKVISVIKTGPYSEEEITQLLLAEIDEANKKKAVTNVQ